MATHCCNVLINPTKLLGSVYPYKHAQGVVTKYCTGKMYIKWCWGREQSDIKKIPTKNVHVLKMIREASMTCYQ